MMLPASTIALLTSITLAGGLWPFGAADQQQGRERIGDLDEREIEFKAQPDIADSGALAREQYRLFLDMSVANPALHLEALRRLGDLNLSAGENRELIGDINGSHGFFVEAVRLYEALLADNPGYKDTDMILYQLARAAETIGEPERALATLDRLVTTYPDSDTFDEAQFRRAEILFINKRYAEAERAYAAVIGVGPASAYFEQSLYKHGWALFKLGRHEASLVPFMDLLDRRMAGNDDAVARLDSLSRPERELVDDTFRVLSITFSYLDGHASINALVTRRGNTQYSNLLYANLGDLYIDKERYIDAAKTYAAFVAHEPTHDRSPALQVKVVEAYTLAKFPSLVLEAKREFVTLYGMDSAFWTTRTQAGYPQVIATLKESLNDLAAYDHARARQDDDAAAYLIAADWYRRYLAYFPDDPESAGYNFLLADILVELALFDQASAEYQRTAYEYGGHERAAEAAYAGLLAARRYGETLGTGQADPWQAEFVAQALRFSRTFPQHEQAVPVLTKVAEDLFAAGKQESALRVGGLIVTWPYPAAPEYEQTAWTVVAHANFERERYAYAEQAYQTLLQFPSGSATRRDKISARIAASVYRQGEQARAAGDDELAVAEFLRVGAVVPGSTFVSTALLDAAALLITGARWDEAVAVLERFRSTYPEHPFNDDVTQKLAVAYQESGHTTAAANEYERIARFDGADPALHREALWQAAELYAATDALDDQRRVYRDIVARFPQPFAESLEARQKLADLAGEANDRQDRQKWLHAIVSADARAGAARTDRSKTLAARASLELAAPVRDAFLAVKLTVPLQKSLQLKKKRMEYALAAYGGTADYGVGEVTTAATYEIADLYYQLSQDLMASERPTGLNDEEIEQYDILLEEQAFPFEEQAIDILVTNTARTQDGIYDDWIRKSFARLAGLMPARFAKSERSERFVAIID